MISHIKNVYVRRIALVLALPLILVAAGVIGAAKGALEYVTDSFDAARDCWKK